jgi:FkbM family methyltransferase
MVSLFDLPEFRDTYIHIVDAGAMGLGDEIYAPLERRGRARVLGFEPVPEECEKLNSSSGPGHCYLPWAVGDGRRRTLQVCNYSMTSSLYEPDSSLLNLYQALGEFVQVVRRMDLQTIRLDDLPEAREADFLKLDVQGAELDILLGAPATLSHVLAVHTEVEFVPLYRNQPLFAEVNQELRRRGFYFHRFYGISGRPLKPLLKDNNPSLSMGQMLWADAVYVRDPQRLGELTPAALLKLAVITHEIYGSYDYVAKVLEAYDFQTGGSVQPVYLARLTGQPVADTVDVSV